MLLTYSSPPEYPPPPPGSSIDDLGLPIAVLLGAVVLIWLLRGLFRRRPPEKLPYFSRTFLLSQGEIVFYRALRQALSAGPELMKLMICPKVRLGDVIHCSGAAWKAGYGGRISQKHVDFVLADVSTTEIRLVIELDDRTHQRADRRRRDEFMDAALAVARVPILREPAAANYDAAALRSRITDALASVAAAAAV